MLDFFTKNKVSEKRLADIFVNTTIKIAESNFDDVATLMENISEFETQPKIDHNNYNSFVFIVVSTNIKELSKHFDAHQTARMANYIFEAFANIYGVTSAKFKQIIQEYSTYLSRVNHPSKNNVYAMSKAMFHKYKLNDFQSEYFKSLNSPNPLFLKKMDEVMERFIWNWKMIKENNKISS